MKRVGGHRRHRQHRGGEEEGELESVPGMQDSVVDVGAVAAAGRRQGAKMDPLSVSLRGLIKEGLTATPVRVIRCDRTDEEPHPPVHKQTANPRAYGPSPPETTRLWSSISFFPADKYDDWNSGTHQLECTF